MSLIHLNAFLRPLMIAYVGSVETSMEKQKSTHSRMIGRDFAGLWVLGFRWEVPGERLVRRGIGGSRAKSVPKATFLNPAKISPGMAQSMEHRNHNLRHQDIDAWCHVIPCHFGELMP